MPRAGIPQAGDALGLQNAEVNYQLLYKNWPASEFTYQAQMMAGPVAAMAAELLTNRPAPIMPPIEIMVM